MLTSTPDSSLFDFGYVPDSRLLRGCWHGTVTADDLYGHYAELMAAAETHGNCRFWLLDMRLRNWHTSSFSRWFGNEFAELAHITLGQPIFMAYVLHPNHRAIADSPGMQAVQCHCAAHGVYPFFFDHDAAALDWLMHQQAHDAALFNLAAGLG